MSDHGQAVVAIDCRREDALARSRDVAAWLVERGIVEPETDDGVFGKRGHPPGPRFTEVVDEEYRPDTWAAPDGVEVVTERRSYFDPSLEQSLLCSRCGNEFETDPDVFVAALSG